MPIVSEVAKPKKHAHGRLYRVKIAPFSGPVEYGEWFGSEALLRSAMGAVARNIGSRYYCEVRTMDCAECEVDPTPKVIAAL
jgi:hypothetical protein